MARISADKDALYLGTVPELAAARRGDTVLTLDHDLDVLPGTGRQITVAELARHVADMSARLWAAGVRPGERVAIHKAANFDIYLLATAAARIGAVPVMLSPALDGDSVAALLERLQGPHLVTDQDKLEGSLAEASLADLTKQLIVTAGSHSGAISLNDLAGAPSQPPVFQDPDEPALMTHTSGTTGLPKLVVHSARSLRGRFRPQNRLVSLIRKRETVAIHVSYVHSRMYLALAVLLPRAMPLVIMNDSDPEKTAELFAQTRPGFLETHPNSFMEWEELVDHPRRPLANVKYFSTTFDAIHPGTMDRLLRASERRSPMFFQIYGQSECGPLVGRGYTRRNAHRANGRCLGYGMPGITSFRLVSRKGERPSRETPGYIEVRTPGRAVTYFGEEERFQQQVFGEWWRGGDVGYRSRFGCLHLLDREVDVIPNIHSTLEVEATVLARMEELTELVLVRGPRQEPLPVVCTRQDRPLDVERWRRAVADFPQLSDPVQLPLAELPRTATMKVQRIELARRMHELLDPTK
ncbi:class I adenylate-forming enzyme family protein [Streptomyces tailanensis]|uniref:class I adenylate-forming enzyme family protein n=1 Tax=Streptomyces tailanensis TaxID=2569858 RepID=UPI00122E33FD|nr:AMP-binding protein [Streptomyces tailanensis]